jgi:hypothetical protein
MNRTHISLLLTALFLALAPTALASNTWYVNGVSGNNSNNCQTPQTACKTIGHAISLAASGDSIIVAAATYTENLTIGFSLKVIGSGASTTIIDGNAAGTVITISQNTQVTLSNITIRNGLAWYGGGISNLGTLTISNSTVSGNLAFTRSSGFGGGIVNWGPGTMTINNSTVSGNTASGGSEGSAGSGAGIFNYGGTLTVNNSTISGNSVHSHFAISRGGGISNSGILRINNSTISGNSTDILGKGAGIWNNSSAVLQNSIVANNLRGGNCYGGLTYSNGYNLSSDGTCNFSSRGDLNNHDPLLGPLQNNGGPTETMALLPGSLAIDAGNPAGCTDGLGHLLKTDQRGMPRPDKEDSVGCDMGAYESQSD